MPKRMLVAVLASSVLLSAGMRWGYAQQNLRPRALTTQDQLEIEQLYARYYQTIDASDAEGWAGTFTPDGVFNNVTGHDALTEFIRHAGATRTRHLQSNLIVTPTAQGAAGTVYVFQVDIKARPLTVASYSRYDDTLVKLAQGWRFKTRTRSTDTTMTPAAANAAPVASDRR